MPPGGRQWRTLLTAIVQNPSKAIATLTIRGKRNYYYVVSSILVMKSQLVNSHGKS